jgi:NitT/TauT family transport system substrate-binding protein
MRMKTGALIAAAWCLAAVGGVASAQEPTTINVLTPLPRHTAWYPLIVGETLGYFAEEGVKVELVPGGDLPATAFLESGQVDLASLDASEVINARQRGFDFDVVYEVMHGAIEGIYVLDSNAAQRLADLKGTTIGIVGESDRSLLMAALGHAGLTQDDVTIAVLGESAPLLANSLNGGAVSAVVGAASDLVAMRSQGLQLKNLLPEEMSEQPANSFAMRADKLDERGPLMQGFFRAWAKSAYAGSVDKATVAEMTKRVAPENWVREDLGMLFLENAIGLHSPDAGVYGDLRTPVWEGVEKELMAVGELPAMIPTADFLDPRFVAAANGFDKEEVKAELAAWKAENMKQ